jgi:hypothetical protein
VRTNVSFVGLEGFVAMVQKNRAKGKFVMHFVKERLCVKEDDLVSETVNEVLSGSQITLTSVLTS